jgi:plasmid stabilization system protein ParE
MRRLRYAATFETDFKTLVAFGAVRFGKPVADTKTFDVLAAINDLLLPFPRLGKPIPTLKLYAYEIRTAPLTILYDFDADEVRIHTVIHARSDIPRTDLTKIVW